MLIGIIGAPNKGKSTFFSSITEFDAQIANYPFTTIEPNRAIAYLRVQCPSVELGVKSKPRDGWFEKGMRKIPVELLDVAGLVPKAHEGRGMGNRFLDDLSSAEGFLHIIDASAKTDLSGNPAQNFDMLKEIEFLDEELQYWLLGILKRNISKYRTKSVEALCSVLSGISYDQEIVKKCVRESGMDQKRIEGSDLELERLSVRLSKHAKPKVIVANKADIENSLERIESVRKNTGWGIIACSAQYEYVLQMAKKKGLIKYTRGDSSFEICEWVEPKQKVALQKILEFVQKNGGTGVHQALHRLIFEKIGMIVVYPVENENTYSDSNSNVLPDAILMPKGSKVIDLAKKVHGDLAKNFIGAIDARKKIKVAKDQPLKNKDIIKIISGK